MDSPLLELRDSSQAEKLGSAASSELYMFEPGSLPNVFYSDNASSLPSPPEEKKRGVGEGKGGSVISKEVSSDKRSPITSNQVIAGTTIMHPKQPFSSVMTSTDVISDPELPVLSSDAEAESSGGAVIPNTPRKSRKVNGGGNTAVLESMMSLDPNEPTIELELLKYVSIQIQYGDAITRSAMAADGVDESRCNDVITY
eukprot:TRINITY_DN1132_c0_g2_i1.p1 TRINITY_DN1132_c0_g2~~TRINITY_DN1132_c0_g2_i1.p1  ORF type:complete len:206 (+),score=29.98 TRINITY_DN1132_c0_g2_i1:22-618(+)